MFAIGAKVVHPCYGAGTIVRVSEKHIGATTRSYYIINTVSRPMELMVPVSRAEEVELRDVGEADTLREQLTICTSLPQEEEINKDLRSRQAAMRENLKSGSFASVATVARMLFFLNNRRPLGTIDRQLFEQSKEFLAGELALAADEEIDKATKTVQAHLAMMLEGKEEAE